MEDFLERWYPEQVRGDEQIRRLVQREYRWDGAGFAPRDSADLHALLQHHERTRLLTVTRRGPRGVEQVNRAIHARCLRDSRVELSPSFLPGEPVLMRHNDYQRGLFNGDRGIVVRVRSSETGDGRQRYRVVFPRGDGFALFRIESLRAHLELAYATTVHQSQGSEFECVALLLPESDLPLLSRELVYTAMTRARRSVVLIGDRSVLNAGIRRTIERFSGLADAL
jgi:exodeoxyribonuclease V alpha subunit